MEKMQPFHESSQPLKMSIYATAELEKLKWEVITKPPASHHLAFSIEVLVDCGYSKSDPIDRWHLVVVNYRRSVSQ